MKVLKYMFTEANGAFSWRKALACLTGFVFTFSCIGYQFGLRQLPKPYYIIIGGVFTFYFSKNILTKTKKDDTIPKT